MRAICYFADAGFTLMQWNGFWLVLTVFMTNGASLAIILGYLKKRDKSRKIEPQPLEVQSVSGVASERDCRERYERHEKQIAQLYTFRDADDAQHSRHRKSIYDKMDELRKELGENIANLPDRITAQLLNSKRLFAEPKEDK